MSHKRFIPTKSLMLHNKELCSPVSGITGQALPSESSLTLTKLLPKSKVFKLGHHGTTAESLCLYLKGAGAGRAKANLPHPQKHLKCFSNTNSGGV